MHRNKDSNHIYIGVSLCAEQTGLLLQTMLVAFNDVGLIEQ